MKKVYLSALGITVFGLSGVAQKHIAQPLTNSKNSLIEHTVKKRNSSEQQRNHHLAE